MITAGAQVSSLQAYLQTPQQMEETFCRLGEMGYRIVQILWVNPEIPPETIAEALKKAGLISVSTQDYYSAVIEHLEDTLRLHDLCGSRNVCISGIPYEFFSEDGCMAFAEKLTAFAAQMEAQNKVASFHPRAQEYRRFGDKTAVDILMENTPDSFQLGLDLYHLIKAGLDPDEWMHRYQGRIEFVHFKDCCHDSSGKELLVPLGQGEIDWASSIRACKETGVKWAFAEQERWQKDAFQCMAESLAFLKENGINP